jgi:hypothetical protein
LRGFVGFIPKRLKIEDKPELSIFPLNILIGRYTVREGKPVLGSVIYEPDLSSLILNDKSELTLNYRSYYDSRYYLKITVSKDLKTRSCGGYPFR